MKSFGDPIIPTTPTTPTTYNWATGGRGLPASAYYSPEHLAGMEERWAATGTYDDLRARLHGGDSGDAGTGGGFNIPTGTYPRSQSSSESESTNAIDWSSPLGQTLLPMIQERASMLPGLADSLSGTLQGQYNSLMRQSLQPQAFQGVLNQLAGRGVLSSTVAEGALSGTASQIARDIANQGYMSQLQGVAAQMKVPGMLGQLAELARVAETQSTSQQEYSDPLAPYTLMAQLLMSA